MAFFKIQGRMVACGRYEELINSGLDIALLLKEKSDTKQSDNVINSEVKPHEKAIKAGLRIPEESPCESNVLQNGNVCSKLYNSDNIADGGIVTNNDVICLPSFVNNCNVDVSKNMRQLGCAPLLSRSMTLLTKKEPEESVLPRYRSQVVLPLRRSSIDKASSVWSLGTELEFEVCC